jgi:3-oxoacyl-[acyl-carrier-protein] synthase-3
MAVRAGSLALERSGVRPDDVALLLHSSMWYQGLDYWTAAPYVHHAVLGDNHLAPAMDMGAMCSGSVGSVDLAASYLAADPARRAVMVTTADRFQLPGFDRWHTEGPSIVYGDGAASMVLSKDGGFARLLAVKTFMDSSMEAMCRGDAEFGLVSSAASGPIDTQTRHRTYVMGVGVEQTIARTNKGLADAVNGVMDEAGVSIADISKFVFPNVGRSLLTNAYLKPLGAELSATAWELGRTTGHVGGADALTGLTYLVEQGQINPGERVLLMGVGYGFMWACAVVECHELPQWTTR